jgi:hypothetical protein
MPVRIASRPPVRPASRYSNSVTGLAILSLQQATASVCEMGPVAA